MHNWWLATLEHAGILAREEAQKISDELKTSMHHDNYVESFRQLETILGEKDFSINRIKKLEAEIKRLASKFDETPKSTEIAKTAPVLATLSTKTITTKSLQSK